jgi:hypothetical protein
MSGPNPKRTDVTPYPMPLPGDCKPDLQAHPRSAKFKREGVPVNENVIEPV